MGRDIRTAAALAAILLFGLALRISFWYGIVNVDPFAYADAAESVVRGLPVFDPELVGNLYYTQYLRLSLVLPAAGTFALFGPGEWQATVVPIFCSLATGAVAFLLVMHISGDRFAGCIAAFVTVVFPESVINSTQFLPDTVMAFFSALTILLFWKGLDAADLPWRQRAGIFAVTGLTWALAFYGRQTAIGLALPLAALVLYKRRFDPAVFAGIPGALLVVASTSVLLVSLGGGPLEDIRTALAEGRGSQPGALGYTDLDWTYLRTFTSAEKFVPLSALVVIGAALIAFTWRSRPSNERNQIAALLLVIAGLFVYFEFLMRLPTLYSWIKEPRYVLVMVVPLAAGVGIGFSACGRAFTGHKRLAAHGLAALALGGTAVFNINTVREDHDYWQTHRIDQLARDAAAVLESRPETVVFIWNDDLARYMSLHIGLERNSVYERQRGEGYLQNWFDGAGRSRVAPGSLVVISPGQDHWSKPTAHARSWDFVWSDGKETSIWSVPTITRPTPMTATNIGLSPEVKVTGFGTAAAAVFGQQSVVFSIQTMVNSGAAVHIAISIECPGESAAMFDFEARPGEAATTSEATVNLSAAASTRNCEVIASANAGPPSRLASILVGGLIRIEPEDSLTYDDGSTTGWYRRDSAAFSSGAAIATSPYQPHKLSIPQLGGDIWLDLGVYDYGTGENTLRVTLNGLTRSITWGSGTAGLVHRQIALRGVPPGAELTLIVESAGQPAVTLDSVVISTIAPPVTE